MSALNSTVSRKISGSGLNVMSVPVFLALPMTCKFLDRLAALEFHVMHFAAARDLDLEPFAHRVDALRADAVRAAGKFVAALAVFAAGMQRRQHQFDAGNLVLRMDVHRNAAAVVADGNRAVHVDRHFDLVAMAGEMFVHGIVQHLARRNDAARARPCRRYTCRASCARPPDLRVFRAGPSRNFPSPRRSREYFSLRTNQNLLP